MKTNNEDMANYTLEELTKSEEIPARHASAVKIKNKNFVLNWEPIEADPIVEQLSLRKKSTRLLEKKKHQSASRLIESMG